MTKAKKILSIISVVLLAVCLALLITSLVNYYSYVSTLKTLSSQNLDLLTKFELQESRETYLFRTLKTLVWTAYVSIPSIITGIVCIILNCKKENTKKFR